MVNFEFSNSHLSVCERFLGCCKIQHDLLTKSIKLMMKRKLIIGIGCFSHQLVCMWPHIEMYLVNWITRMFTI